MLGRTTPVTLDRLRYIGEHSAECMRQGEDWVHRRVESITWVDERVWRRHVSIDFTIPEGLPASRRRGDRDLYYVPVASLQKWPPLLNLDLHSAEGQAHLLTSNGNAVIDAAMLYGLARHAMGVVPARAQRATVESLARETNPALAAQAYDKLMAAVPSAADPGRRRRLASVAGTMINASFLWFPVLANVGERHVVKFSYDEIHEEQSSLRRGIALGLAWSPRREWIEIEHMGDSRSNHIELQAPDGLVFDSDSRLLYVTEATESPPEGGSMALNTQTIGQRLHAYMRTAKPGSGFLYVGLKPPRSGFITSAWGATAAITFLMFLFWRWGLELAKDTQSAVAILILVPVLLGYIAVRPVVHPVAIAHVAHVRNLLLLSGGLSIFAALAIVHDGKLQKPEDARGLCGQLLLAEAAILALLTVSWYRAEGEWQPPARIGWLVAAALTVSCVGSLLFPGELARAGR
jgi:hypothetical protein